MSQTPATPDQGRARLMGMLSKSKDTMSADTTPSADRSKQVSHEDSSPATTIAAEGSTSKVPPQKDEENEGIAGDLGAVKLDDDQVTVKNDSPAKESTKNGIQSFVIPLTMFASSARPGGNFVQQSGHSEDPFVSTSSNTQPSTQGNTINYQPRDDRAGTEPTNSTAQALFGPEACVFVANLSKHLSDEQLEHGVTTVFSKFGRVWTKIRRDGSGMPFAFAQFENENVAKDAIANGRGLSIHGRPCRTEVAKVNRALYLSKIAGGPITEDEAHAILRGHGAIEQVWHSTQTDRELNDLPDGIWVRFHYYDDCRDAQTAFRENTVYRLEQLRKREGVMPRVPPQWYSFGSPASRRPLVTHGLGPIARTGESGPAEWVIDRCSIFVGNLPLALTNYDIAQMFSQFGHVRDVAIFHKSSTHYRLAKAFCFVEFTHRSSTERAVQMGPTVFVGLRIEFKESRPYVASPYVLAQTSSPIHSAGAWGQRAVAANIYNNANEQQGHLSTPGPIGGVFPPTANNQYLWFSGYAPMDYYEANEAAQTYGMEAQPFNGTNTSPATHQSPYSGGLFDNASFQLNFGQGNGQVAAQAAPNGETSYVWPPTNTDNGAGPA